MWYLLLIPVLLWFCCCFISLIALGVLFWLYHNFSKKRFLFGTLNNKYIPKAIEVPVVFSDPEIMEILYAYLPKFSQSLKDIACTGLVDEIFVKTMYGPKVPLRYLTHYNDISRDDVLEFVIKKPVVLQQHNKIKMSELKSNSKNFMSEMMQNGYAILENDEKNWATLFSNQVKSLSDLFGKGDPIELSEKAQWKIESRRPNLIINANKMLPPRHPTSIEDVTMESSMNMYDHLDDVSKEILELMAEELGKQKDFFTQYQNLSNSLNLCKYGASKRSKSQISYADLSILSIFTKGSKSSLMVLNQTSLDWERVEDRMTNDDILVYPGYYMSYMTDASVPPLLLSLENNQTEDRFNSTFQYRPDVTTKFVNSNGQHSIERITRSVTSNRKKFYLDFTLNHITNGLKEFAQTNFGGKPQKLDE